MSVLTHFPSPGPFGGFFDNDDDTDDDRYQWQSLMRLTRRRGKARALRCTLSRSWGPDGAHEAVVVGHRGRAAAAFPCINQMVTYRTSHSFLVLGALQENLQEG